MPTLRSKKKYHEAGFMLEPEILTKARTPMPMHGLVPRNILGGPWWQRTRKAAFALTKDHCIACGVHKSKAKERKWLEGHEVYDVNYVRGRWKYVKTVGLCHCCHNYVHMGRLMALLEQGKISFRKYQVILAHGEAVLSKHGLKKQVYYGPIASWREWRLVLDKRKFQPLFSSAEEARAQFTKGHTK